MIVYATREGLIGGVTASGYRVDRLIPFVALPSVRALHRFVWVRALATNRLTYAIVLDVGPWNTHDDAYVFDGQRPQAESGIDQTGRPTNYAGIDLGERVWALLGMTDNGPVEWGFLPPLTREDPERPVPALRPIPRPAAASVADDTPRSTSDVHRLDTVAA